MYRSALVALKPEGLNEELLNYAVELAQRYSLRLSGTAILDRDLVAPPQAVPLGGMAFKVELDEDRIARTREQMVAAITTFREHCAAARVPFDDSCSSGSLCPELARAAQRNDFLLLGHTNETLAVGHGQADSPLQAILRHCPGPALVVPARPPADADGVVVAYDGSLQAVRALRSFIASGFNTKDPVHVVSYDIDFEAARQLALTAQGLLASHGFQACAAPGSIPSGQTEASLIQAACRLHDPRLLVMGAYGKSAVREFFLGSVTKSLLAEAQVPIFVDH